MSSLCYGTRCFQSSEEEEVGIVGERDIRLVVFVIRVRLEYAQFNHRGRINGTTVRRSCWLLVPQGFRQSIEVLLRTFRACAACSCAFRILDYTQPVGERLALARGPTDG